MESRWKRCTSGKVSVVNRLAAGILSSNPSGTRTTGSPRTLRELLTGAVFSEPRIDGLDPDASQALMSDVVVAVSPAAEAGAAPLGETPF